MIVLFAPKTEEKDKNGTQNVKTCRLQGGANNYKLKLMYKDFLK